MVVDEIKAIRELLSTPDKWTKGHYSLDANGEPVCPFDPTATCWCLEGAASAVRASRDTFDALYTNEMDSIIRFNDDPNTTHDDILNFLDSLIRRYNGV